MASINYAARQISVKIVYYGPGLSGKTTNLQVIHKKTPQEHKSDMVSLATETDRTLFFDFLPLDLGKIKQFDTKFQLYTVPGQVYYNATRKLVLRGVDGVVFVADSGADKIQENLESFQNLEDNLAEYGYLRDSIPIIIQYNKRDLPNALPIDELNRHINKYNLPYGEGIAYKGVGVFDTLKQIGKIVIDHLNKKYSRGGRTTAAAPTATPPAPPSAAPVYQPPQQQAWEQPAPAYQPPPQAWEQPAPAYQPPQQQAWDQPVPAYQPPQQQTWDQPMSAYQPPQQQYAPPPPVYQPQQQQAWDPQPAVPPVNMDPFAMPQTPPPAPAIPSFDMQAAPPAPDPYYAAQAPQFERPTVAQQTVPDNPFMPAAPAYAAQSIPSFDMAPAAQMPPPAQPPQVDFDDAFMIEPQAQRPGGVPPVNQGGFQQSPFEFEMPSPPAPMGGTQNNSAPTGGGSDFSLESFSGPTAAPAISDMAFDYNPSPTPAQADFGAMPVTAMEYSAKAPSAVAAHTAFGAPQPDFGAMQSDFGTPQPDFGAMQSDFGAPQPAFGTIQSDFGAPQPAAQPEFGAPAPMAFDFGAGTQAQTGFGAQTPEWGATDPFKQPPPAPDHSAFSDFEAELEGRKNDQEFNESEGYPSDSAMFFTTVDRNTAMLKRTGKPPVNPAKKAAQQQKGGIMSKLLRK